MNVQTVGGVVRPEGVFAADGFERVRARENVDLVAAATERPRQSVDVRRVPAETLGAKERRHHAEFQGGDLLSLDDGRPCPRSLRKGRASGDVVVEDGRSVKADFAADSFNLLDRRDNPNKINISG